MFARILTGCVAAAIMLGTSSAALAQAASTGGDTTCSDFTAMDAAGQAALIVQLQANVNAGAASSSATGGANATPETNTGASTGTTTGSSGAVSAGAVDESNVGPVVTACQNDPSLTVGEALTQTSASGD